MNCRCCCKTEKWNAGSIGDQSDKNTVVTGVAGSITNFAGCRWWNRIRNVFRAKKLVSAARNSDRG